MDFINFMALAIGYTTMTALFCIGFAVVIYLMATTIDSIDIDKYRKTQKEKK